MSCLSRPLACLLFSNTHKISLNPKTLKDKDGDCLLSSWGPSLNKLVSFHQWPSYTFWLRHKQYGPQIPVMRGMMGMEKNEWGKEVAYRVSTTLLSQWNLGYDPKDEEVFQTGARTFHIEKRALQKPWSLVVQPFQKTLWQFHIQLTIHSIYNLIILPQILSWKKVHKNDLNMNVYAYFVQKQKLKTTQCSSHKNKTNILSNVHTMETTPE